MAKRVLDLHGYTTSEAEAALDLFLHHAKQVGLGKVKILTGKGTGAVRSAVIRKLRFRGCKWEYELKGKKKIVNEGCLVVVLKETL